MGGSAIIGGDEPWATLDPTGGARWLEADWQGSIGESARDPWGADGAAGPGEGLRLGWRGEVEVDGLVWLRHRAYDPATRAFLSTDPLPGVPGTASAANPYHYANNDPLGWVDPLGLRPLTDADLRAYKQAAARNLLERGADWAQDNWEYVAAGAAIIAGAALIATGVGSPLGAVLIGGALIGGRTSAGLQKFTTGEVDWGRVAIDAAIGGAAENITAGAATRAAYGENPFNPPALGKDLFLGGGTGALGGRLGAGQVSRAGEDFVDLTTSARRAHILRGNVTGGGHLWPGLPGKTPFPQSWSPDRIIHEISDVATDPAATRATQGGKTVVTGMRGGVEIRVIIENATDEIMTGYPVNLPRNPP